MCISWLKFNEGKIIVHQKRKNIIVFFIFAPPKEVLPSSKRKIPKNGNISLTQMEKNGNIKSDKNKGGKNDA